MGDPMVSIEAFNNLLTAYESLHKRNEQLERVASLAETYHGLHDKWMRARTSVGRAAHQDALEKTRGSLFEALSALDKED